MEHGDWGFASRTTHLELIRLPCPDQLGHEEVCVKKVDVLIQEAMEDEQAIRPGGDRGGSEASEGQMGFPWAQGLFPAPVQQAGQNGGKGYREAPCPGIWAWWNVLDAYSHCYHH